jgi:hypothetical protein
VLELVGIVHVLDGGTGREGEVVESFGRGQDEGLLLVGVGSDQELVEDVEGSFAFSSVDDTSLFQEVGLETGSGNQTSRVELKTNEFTETRRVVVLVGLGVTEGFKKRVELNELLF